MTPGDLVWIAAATGGLVALQVALAWRVWRQSKATADTGNFLVGGQ